jgi:hypothetical protein
MVLPMGHDSYDEDDRDAPQPMDLREGDGDNEFDDEIIACPNCGGQLHAEAAVCPTCGEWMMDESPAARRSRGWLWPVVVGVLVALVLVWHRLG